MCIHTYMDVYMYVYLYVCVYICICIDEYIESIVYLLTRNYPSTPNRPRTCGFGKAIHKIWGHHLRTLHNAPLMRAKMVTPHSR